jgi:hypothetical protein
LLVVYVLVAGAHRGTGAGKAGDTLLRVDETILLAFASIARLFFMPMTALVIALEVQLALVRPAALNAACVRRIAVGIEARSRP